MTQYGNSRLSGASDSHRQTGITEFVSDGGTTDQDSTQPQTQWPLFTHDLPADISQRSVASQLNDACAVLAGRDDMTPELIISGLEQYIDSVLTTVAPVNPPRTVDPASVFDNRVYMQYSSQFRPVYINLDATGKTLIREHGHTPHDIYTGATELLALVETRLLE